MGNHVSRWALAGLLLCGCATQRHLTDPVEHGAGRSRQLMILAAAEARHIPDADVRLTRQLNIANDMQSRYGKEGVAEALREATRSLNEVGNQLTGHARVSGWVSVAQLAHRASEKPLATEAAQRSVGELDQMQSMAERCDYVLGVAEEVSHALGPAAAAALLEKSGDWAASIELAETRRMARLAFASALFNLEEYEAGATVLRKENDPVWSSEAMLRLASPTSYYAYAPRPQPAQPAAMAPPPVAPTSVHAAESYSFSDDSDRAPPAPAHEYGKQVGFDSVFQGRTTSAAAPR